MCGDMFFILLSDLVRDDDATVEAARARLGPRAIIGVSCYADLDRARDLPGAGRIIWRLEAFTRHAPNLTPCVPTSRC